MIGPMLDHRWRITAIDFSPAAIKFCRQMKGAGSVDGFIVADAESLPFGECSFDAVFCNHLLGHLYRSGRVACAEEATRVLRSNGYLFLRAFTGDDMRAGRGTMVEPGTYLRGDGIITHYFSPEEVIRVFPTLTLVESSCPRWTIRIRGEDHQHAEIVAVFQK
jgi:SAM-dependent methyltransferase